MKAPDAGIARIVGAGAAIIAVEGLAGQTRTVFTDIPDGADIPVGARGLVGSELAPIVKVAGIIGAWIGIVTGDYHPTFARTARTDVVSGAGIAVVAGLDIGCEEAPLLCVARIVGARVAIIAG